MIFIGGTGVQFLIPFMAIKMDSRYLRQWLKVYEGLILKCFQSTG